VRNKFLIGARRVGTLLALVLMGASGAWASDVVSVNLNAFKEPAFSATSTPSLASLTAGAAEYTWYRHSQPVGTVYNITSAGTTDEVVATMNMTSTAGKAGPWDGILVIKAHTTVKKLVISGGELPKDKVKQIVFTGGNTNDFIVQWDGGSVVGMKEATVSGVSNGANAVDRFLSLQTTLTTEDTPDGSKHIEILSTGPSGVIESWAKYIIRDVGGTDGANGHVLGAANNPGEKNITLKSHGNGAAVEVVYGLETAGSVSPSISPPGIGKYLIESDSIAVLAKTASTKIVLGHSDQSKQGAGSLVINGWTKATTVELAGSASKGAVDGGILFIYGKNLTGGGKGIVISSFSKYGVRADGKIDAARAEIQHKAPLKTSGAAAIITSKNSTASTNVEINPRPPL